MTIMMRVQRNGLTVSDVDRRSANFLEIFLHLGDRRFFVTGDRQKLAINWQTAIFLMSAIGEFS